MEGISCRCWCSRRMSPGARRRINCGSSRRRWRSRDRCTPTTSWRASRGWRPGLRREGRRHERRDPPGGGQPAQPQAGVAISPRARVRGLVGGDGGGGGDLAVGASRGGGAGGRGVARRGRAHPGASPPGARERAYPRGGAHRPRHARRSRARHGRRLRRLPFQAGPPRPAPFHRPRAVHARREGPLMHARYDPAPNPTPRPTILVVDDEEANVKLMRTYLKVEGFEVATASCGRDALELVRRGVDLVLLDIRMPGMDGLEVCRRIRADGANARLPVVFLTAELGDPDSEVEGLAAGADEFLHKPVHRPALVARVRNLLRLANAERDRQLMAQLAQAEKLAAIGQIAAGVAHEINNPLAFILSNLATLTTYVGDVTRVLDAYRSSKENGLATERELDFAQTLEDIGSLIRETSEGGQRVRAIVQGLKSFSRTDDGGAEPLDLSEVAASTLLLTEREISSRATLSKELSAAPVERAPRNKLEQVVLNLLVNALQALNGRDLRDCRIRIATGQDATQAWLSVSDSGCGMEPAVRARLFEPFFTTKPVGEGTGMGLSFSENVIRKLGGRIDVESEVGKGSTFT